MFILSLQLELNFYPNFVLLSLSDFTGTRRKCENLNMSSLSSKSDDVIQALESHYACRVEPNLTFASSINCEDPCNLICSHVSRNCSDHVYDMPQRPEIPYPEVKHFV